MWGEIPNMNLNKVITYISTVLKGSYPPKRNKETAYIIIKNLPGNIIIPYMCISIKITSGIYTKFNENTKEINEPINNRRL